ncbi:MAG: hypothetical protein RMJ35_06595, partial [Phycisphaerales bacterium]|nr:hypothetical protein [Phycisphaerales bacterium]
MHRFERSPRKHNPAVPGDQASRRARRAMRLALRALLQSAARRRQISLPNLLRLHQRHAGDGPDAQQAR